MSRLGSGEPEIFLSIQGEGRSAGEASAFLRLATCNLTCSWCDTSYTWDWSRYDYSEQVMGLSPQDVFGRIHGLDTENVVVTGGEPLLQQAAGLDQLVTQLTAAGHSIEVETNGTICPSGQMVDSVMRWNVSPKIENSGNPAARREVPEALRAFSALPNADFKFVIRDRPDVDEAAGLAAAYRVPPERVVLMPEGADAKDLAARSPWVRSQADARGFRFSTRLQILLWGAERGR